MRKRMAVQIKRYGRSFAILLVLMVIGTASGAYILLQQRLPNPFDNFYSVNAQFPTAAAVVPGLGLPVNVAGVHVGEISGVSLQNGLGVVHMQIDPSKMKQIYRNAEAELVPNTPLKDMEVDITPGSPSAGVLPHGGTIGGAQTTSPVDSDDLLDSLDTDTRTWLTSLVADLDQGTSGRGKDIRGLLTALGPTAQQLQEVGDLLAARRTELADIVHNLGVVTQATSAKDAQLRTVVQAGDATVHALANQDVALRASISRLPSTLQTARTTLTNVAGLANVLGPTATALLPTARRLPATLNGAKTLFEGAALLPLKQIPPFIKVVLPLAAQLPPITHDLSAELPSLIDSFKVLAYTTNEIAYNPGGKNPGFLYWLAWFAHDADSFLSTEDAHGAAWRGLLVFTCAGLRGAAFGPLLEAALGSTFGC